MKRSWPFFAETSDAARAARSTRLMLSTTTFVLFFWPHSFVYVPLNQVSQAGTKWLHWRIFNVFIWASARSGNRKAGPPTPAATAPPPASFANVRRVIPLDRALLDMLAPLRPSGLHNHNGVCGPLRRRRMSNEI